MSDLFDFDPEKAAEEARKRRELTRRGWKQKGMQRNGQILWWRPDLDVLTPESDAFCWLERQEAWDSERKPDLGGES